MTLAKAPSSRAARSLACRHAMVCGRPGAAESFLTFICSEKSLALRKFNGGDRPLSILARDRDSQAVKFVEPDVLCRASLSVCEDHGPSDKLRASLLERAEYRRS